MGQVPPAVRQLYKQILLVGRRYPGDGGFALVCSHAKEGFLRNGGAAGEELAAAIGRGHFVLRELEALVRLHKYRAMKRRYDDVAAPPGDVALPRASTEARPPGEAAVER